MRFFRTGEREFQVQQRPSRVRGRRSGGSREEDATVDGRFAFYRAEGVVYAAKLEANAAGFGITENQLINSFHLIQQDWKTGET